MRRRTLGSTSRSVFPVGLGCMGLSWGYRDASVDEAAAVDLIRRAIDLGVDHFDTADVYFPQELVARQATRQGQPAPKLPGFVANLTPQQLKAWPVVVGQEFDGHGLSELVIAGRREAVQERLLLPDRLGPDRGVLRSLWPGRIS